MFNIDMTQLNGRTFTGLDTKVTYTCIGYGQPPDSGKLLIVGILHLPVQGEDIIRSFLASEVHFISKP